MVSCICCLDENGLVYGFHPVGLLVLSAMVSFVESDGQTLASPPRTRPLGLAVIRGTSLVVISPVEGLVHLHHSTRHLRSRVLS